MRKQRFDFISKNFLSKGKKEMKSNECFILSLVVVMISIKSRLEGGSPRRFALKESSSLKELKALLFQLYSSLPDECLVTVSYWFFIAC